MTEPGEARPAHAPRAAGRQRMPKAAVRGWAWIAGVLAFLAPWAALRANPTPEAASTAAQGRQVRPLVVRTIVRRVIVVPAGSVQSGATRSGTGASQGPDAPADTGSGGAVPPQSPPVSTGGS